jgi:class 3 adenylate cyclase
LNEIIASERGAVVKTIGDAVMATFATLRSRQAEGRADAYHCEFITGPAADPPSIKPAAIAAAVWDGARGYASSQ